MTVEGEGEVVVKVAEVLGALGPAGDQLAVAEVDQEPLPVAVQVAATGATAMTEMTPVEGRREVFQSRPEEREGRLRREKLPLTEEASKRSKE